MTVNMGLTNFVPMIVQWQLQSDKDIYDTIDDWGFHKYICVMKDGEQVEAFGIADESDCGVCSKSITFQDFSDYDTDDIVFWLEIPPTPKLDELEIYKEDKIKDAIRNYREQFLKEIEK